VTGDDHLTGEPLAAGYAARHSLPALQLRRQYRQQPCLDHQGWSRRPCRAVRAVTGLTGGGKRTSPGARAHYDRRRNLYDRLLGYLRHCLATRQPYDEATAFPTTSSNSQATAA
jgi:hypothetical protein